MALGRNEAEKKTHSIHYYHLIFLWEQVDVTRINVDMSPYHKVFELCACRKLVNRVIADDDFLITDLKSFLLREVI